MEACGGMVFRSDINGADNMAIVIMAIATNPVMFRNLLIIILFPFGCTNVIGWFRFVLSQ